MSKIIPPMISSSPPPMDDTLEDDEDDDEFGSFSTASYSYNLDITQPSKLSTNTKWKGTDKHQYDFDISLTEGTNESQPYNDVEHQNGRHSTIEVLSESFLTEEDDEVAKAFPTEIKDVSSILEMPQDNTSQDSVVSVATDSGLCSASQESEETSPLPTVKGFLTSLSASRNVSQDDSSSSEETVVKSTDTDMGVHFTSSSETVGDTSVPVSDNTLPRYTQVAHDLNSCDRLLEDSRQSEKVNEEQFSTDIHQELTNTSMVDDFCDLSDHHTINIRNNSDASALSDSHGNSDNISAATSVLAPSNTSNEQHERLETTSTLNLVGPSHEINIHDEPGRLLSCVASVGKVFDSSNKVKCDYVCKSENIASNLDTNFSNSCHKSSDDFADFASSDITSCPVAVSDDFSTNHSFDSSDEFADFTTCQDQQSLTVASSDLLNEQHNTFGSDDEFSDFTSCAVQSSFVSTSVIKANASLVPSNEHANVASGEEPAFPVSFLASEPLSNEVDDEFADFTCGEVQSLPSMAAKEEGWADESAVGLQLLTVTEDLSQMDDDFDDFETASFSSATMPTVSDHSQLSSRLTNVVTTLFPGPNVVELEKSDATMLTSGHIVERNPVWGDLRDVDTSHALSYQWINSSANKMLLSALGIDTRNILFGAKWNVSVPRFAANLGISPLEPVRAHSPPTLQPTPECTSKSSSTQLETSISSGHEASVPDAQFDWTSSGLVNPLDSEEKDGPSISTSSHSAVNYGQELVASVCVGGRQGLSIEAVKVLESLPDLSFLRTKVLMFPAPGQALIH